jgi:hypothetical protein
MFTPLQVVSSQLDVQLLFNLLALVAVSNSHETHLAEMLYHVLFSIFRKTHAFEEES